jgi:acetyl esterase/lipase
MILAFCATLARAESADEIHRIPYARDDSLQFGDLLLPRGAGPFPLAVVIHGGCWRASVATLASTSALADALAGAGVATWNVEYRRVGNPGGGWPGTFRDVAVATDFARTLAASYPLDLSRVVVVGHSAGAHLALWAAARAKLHETSALYVKSPLPLRGVVAIAGPGDLRPLALRGSICGTGTVERLLGGTLESVPEHYAQASPAALLPLGVRQVLISGSDDDVVPPRLVARYGEAARRAGDRVSLDEIEGANHVELIAPDSSAWPTLEKRVLELVRAH